MESLIIFWSKCSWRWDFQIVLSKNMSIGLFILSSKPFLSESVRATIFFFIYSSKSIKFFIPNISSFSIEHILTTAAIFRVFKIAKHSFGNYYHTIFNYLPNSTFKANAITPYARALGFAILGRVAISLGSCQWTSIIKSKKALIMLGSYSFSSIAL